MSPLELWRENYREKSELIVHDSAKFVYLDETNCVAFVC